MFADGSEPEEVGVGSEALVFLLSDSHLAILHAFADLIESEYLDVAGDHVHVTDSVEHFFVALALGQLIVIG